MPYLRYSCVQRPSYWRRIHDLSHPLQDSVPVRAQALALSRLRGQKRYADLAWAGRITDGNMGGGGDQGDGGCDRVVREDVSFLAGG